MKDAFEMNIRANQVDRHRVIEMIYASMLCPSPMTFVAILLHWVCNVGNDLDWKNENLCLRFFEDCRAHGLDPRGGMYSRLQSQGGKRDNQEPTKKTPWQVYYSQTKDIIKAMKNGTIERNPETDWYVPNWVGIKGMYRYSFSEMLLCTELAPECLAALACAIEAKVNKTNDSPYGENLINKLTRVHELDGTNRRNNWNLSYEAIWKALGFYEGHGRELDGENGFCAYFRGAKKGDIFVYGMDQYTIIEGRLVAKAFNSDKWEDFKKFRQHQRQQRIRLIRNREEVYIKFPCNTQQKKDMAQP